MKKLYYKLNLNLIKIDNWQWVIFLVSTPFFLFPGSWKSIVLLVVPILWILSLLIGRKPIPSTPLNLPILIICLMMLVSLFATYDIGVSLPKIAGMILGIGVFYALVNRILLRKSLKFSLSLFFVVTLSIGVIGLFGTNWFKKVDLLQPFVSRIPLVIKGIQGAQSGIQPNELAGSLLWVLPLLLVLIYIGLDGYKKGMIAISRRVFFIGISLLVIFAIFLIGVFILTQSRGGWIAMAIALLFLVAMLIPPKKRWIYGTGLVLLGIIFVFAAWQFGLVQKINEETTYNTDSALSLNTLIGREEVWSRAIYGIQDFPFTGMGMNTFRTVVDEIYPMYIINPSLDIGHAHDEFLQVALDLGIPGLIAFLAFYLVSAWMLVKTWNRSWKLERLVPEKSPTGFLASPIVVRGLVLGLGGGLLAHAIFGLTDAVALGAKPGILFWILAGLIVGIYQVVGENGSIGQSKSTNG